MTKRVAFITHSFYPIEPRARRMAEAVAERGYQVDVFCLRLAGEPAFERISNVSVHRLPVARRQGGGRLVYLTEYLRFFALAAWHVTRHHLPVMGPGLRIQAAVPYCLAQIYNPPDFLTFSTVLPRLLTGTRVVLDVRDMAPELFMSRFRLQPDHAITRTLTAHERWACRYASAVTVCTKHQFNVMAARGIQPDKMTVIMNTPDDAIFGTPPPLRAWRPDPTRPLKLIYHGSILERYGIDVLIRALPRLIPAIPNIHADIYGFGDFEPAARALAVELGVGDVVQFHGRLPLEAIPAAITAADIGVVPVRRDIFTDTILPTKLMEYAHIGIPAVVGRTSTTTEYFDDDMVAYYTPGDPEDLARQVLALYRDPARAMSLAENARRFTEQHNWAQDEGVYVSLIERLTGGGPVRG